MITGPSGTVCSLAGSPCRRTSTCSRSHEPGALPGHGQQGQLLPEDQRRQGPPATILTGIGDATDEPPRRARYVHGHVGETASPRGRGASPDGSIRREAAPHALTTGDLTVKIAARSLRTAEYVRSCREGRQHRRQEGGLASGWACPISLCQSRSPREGPPQCGPSSSLSNDANDNPTLARAWRPMRQHAALHRAGLISCAHRASSTHAPRLLSSAAQANAEVRREQVEDCLRGLMALGAALVATLVIEVRHQFGFPPTSALTDCRPRSGCPGFMGALRSVSERRRPPKHPSKPTWHPDFATPRILLSIRHLRPPTVCLSLRPSNRALQAADIPRLLGGKAQARRPYGSVLLVAHCASAYSSTGSGCRSARRPSRPRLRHARDASESSIGEASRR